MSAHEIDKYAEAFFPMVWYGEKGYPEQVNSGRCYMTGLVGMLRYYGEPDILFSDGTSGDGFSFRWCPAWGAPAFNGGKGPFHELWEYTPQSLGYKGHWEEDPEGGWDEAILRARLLELRQAEKEEERPVLRGEYTKAEWGSQIRSYVLHPYQMVKDHRTDHETGNTQAVLDGSLSDFMEAYLRTSKEK